MKTITEKLEYIAHKSDGGEQALADHLHSVAGLAEGFAKDFAKYAAFIAGLLHDIGKYSKAFQKRIRGLAIQVEHSAAGALEVEKRLKNAMLTSLILQYVIMGHHSGLPNGGTEADNEDRPTLRGRKKRRQEDYSNYIDEINPERAEDASLERLIEELAKKGRKVDVVELFAFFTRYIFSCLTDADFLDTERFYQPDIIRELPADFERAYDLLEEKLASFTPDTSVRKARAALLSQVKENIKDAAEINILNMPTGSGKTLTSLRAAMELVKREGKKRIVYVIPYTSIIDQTADEFQKTLGDSVAILQHHSNFDFDKDEENEENKHSTLKKLQKSAENWDSPIVITTNVQFFESLYHYKGSRLRRMHNLADSVLIFDEIHTLPTQYLQPCIRAVGYITKYLNSKAIFLSATMPDYDQLFARYIPESTVKNLINDSSPYGAFGNYSITYLGKRSPEALAAAAQNHPSCLLVMGTKRAARELYKLVQGKKFHLSTNMTPVHRKEAIEKIKKALLDDERITVVSTSLIEAGVDLDFAAVYRQLAGIDSILQSAGRCNREGENPNGGDVFVFETDEVQPAEVQLGANVAASLLKESPGAPREEWVKNYFAEIYGFDFLRIDSNSIGGSEKNVALLRNIPFRCYAKQFKLIDEESQGIVINTSKECQKALDKLLHGGLSAKRPLQKFTVGVRRSEFEAMLKAGLVRENGGVYVLSNNDYYSAEYGLSISEEHDEKYIHS